LSKEAALTKRTICTLLAHLETYLLSRKFCSDD